MERRRDSKLALDVAPNEQRKANKMTEVALAQPVVLMPHHLSQLTHSFPYQ